MVDYVKFTDYPSEEKAGVITIWGGYATEIDSYGSLRCNVLTYDEYISETGLEDYGFISKGTLDNVLAAKIGNIEALLDRLDVGEGV